jgi:peptidoglycan/LPS O-acetylase OafA/YrhL
LSDPGTNTRFDGVDGLRAFAVVAVIAAHAHVFWLHGGGVGVDVFFGISGFLITYLLIKEVRRFGRINIGKFWLRRLLRLMPALLVLIICVDLFALLVMQFTTIEYLERSLAATPSVLLYFSNWMIVGTNSAYLGWFGPLWSLSVEEQFYLVWPLVVILAFRFKRPLLLLAIIAGVISIGAVILRFVAFDPAFINRAFGTDFRVDMLLAGVLLAIAMQAGHQKTVKAASRWLVVPAILFLVVVSIFVPEFGRAGTEDLTRSYYTFGLPLVALSTASIIGFVVTHQGSKLTRALSVKPLSYTGKISYGMYLWHYPIVMGLNAVVDDKNVTFVLCLALTYLVATLSWRFVEQPLSKRYHERLKVTQPVREPGAVAT